MTSKAIHPGRLRENGVSAVTVESMPTAAAPAQGSRKESAVLRTQEIIAHVARGEVTPRNSKHRRINAVLAAYLDDLHAQEQAVRQESVLLKAAVRELPPETQDLIFRLLEQSNRSQRLLVERQIMRRAAPLILEYDHIVNLLRRDRDRAFVYIEKLKGRLFGDDTQLGSDWAPEDIPDAGMKNPRWPPTGSSGENDSYPDFYDPDRFRERED